MPYMTNYRTCVKCGESNKLFRNRWNKVNKKWYTQSSCKDCEYKATKKYQEDNRERVREYNRKSYLKKLGSLTRRSPLEMTDALRAEWHRNKSNMRSTRAKHARVAWSKEFTDLIYSEAHKLRVERNKLFNSEWHVDHIIPLKGDNVCGLHVWNNFAVIPKVENLRKGNNHSVHD